MFGVSFFSTGGPRSKDKGEVERRSGKKKIFSSSNLFHPLPISFSSVRESGKPHPPPLSIPPPFRLFSRPRGSREDLTLVSALSDGNETARNLWSRGVNPRKKTSKEDCSRRQQIPNSFFSSIEMLGFLDDEQPAAAREPVDETLLRAPEFSTDEFRIYEFKVREQREEAH